MTQELSSSDPNSKPLVSVIVPAFNVGPYIVPAVKSALAQNGVNLEVIVIDDGSTDDTANRLAALQDARLKVIRQDNRGLSAARNVGVKASVGRYVGFLDGDDVWYPQKVASHVAVLEANQAVGIVLNTREYIDHRGRRTGQHLVSRRRVITLRHLLKRNYIGCCVLVRRACLDTAGLFNESLRACEDWELWVRVMAKTRCTAWIIPQVLSGYRVRPESLTENYEHQIENSRRAIELFAKSVPSLSNRRMRRAMAEVYRICSRKALSSSQFDVAEKLAWAATRCYPPLLVLDGRAAVTVGILLVRRLLPERLKSFPYSFVRRLLAATNKLHVKRSWARTRGLDRD